MVTGNVKVKTEPAPGSLFSQILPPCSDVLRQVRIRFRNRLRFIQGRTALPTAVVRDGMVVLAPEHIMLAPSRAAAGERSRVPERSRTLEAGQGAA
jgi:hypothetical protein